MASKLGVTAERLLRECDANRHGVVTVQFGYANGPNHSKPRPFGDRDHAAALKLEKLGLLETVSMNRHDYYRQGYNSPCTDWTLRRPQSGDSQ